MRSDNRHQHKYMHSTADTDIKGSATRSGRLVCTAGLASLLAVSSLLAPLPAAAASRATESELARLQAKVEDAARSYNEATARANELDTQIDSLADEILEIEEVALPAHQREASQAASSLYKLRQSSADMLAVLLGSDSFDDLITTAKYYETIQARKTDALEKLNALDEELAEKLDDISQAKDKADAERQNATKALASAQSAASAIQRKADMEDEAEAEAARKALELADSLGNGTQNANSNGAPGSSSGQETGGASDAGNGSANSGNASGGGSNGSTAGGGASDSTGDTAGGNSGNGSGNTGGNNGSGGSGSEPNGGNSQAPSEGTWLSGKASYYGIGDGFMGGTTASGDIVTETSMGVAMLNVPLGTRVEIRYRGKSVIAVVNDRGPYAHGRVIDMQPAVARALGFLSVGVDTVQYRFL